MKKEKQILLILFSFFSTFCFGQKIYSFEEGVVPTTFQVKSGTLSIQNEKAKLGTKSLQWNWKAGDELTTTPQYLDIASTRQSGGITVWMYNENPTEEVLKMCFYQSNSSQCKCSLNINLNFKGWRCIWARFREDMGYKGYRLNSMKWKAPQKGSGTILIDYLQFVDNVSWKRISNKQYLVNNKSHLENFLKTRNIPPTTPPSVVTEEQRLGIATIQKRIDEWFFGTEKYADNPYCLRRKNAFSDYVQRAVNKSSEINFRTLPDNTVQYKGLFPLNFYQKTIEGEKVLTFREVSQDYLFQLAYDATKNNNASSRKLIMQFFDWYNDQGWADGSGLGELRHEMLRSGGYYLAAYLMKDNISEEKRELLLNTQKWFSLFGEIYQESEHKGENSDKIRTLLLPKLLIALSISNEKEKVEALRKVSVYAQNTLSLANGYSDCLKPDFSGYHHRGVYFNAYYPDALYVASLVYYFLSDTPYDLGEEVYQNLKNSLLTFRFICSDYNVPAGTTGRFPTQIQILDKLLPAFAYLSLSKLDLDKELTEAFLRLWKPQQEPINEMIDRAKSDITFKNSLGEVEKMVELAEKSTFLVEKEPIGIQFLPFSGLFISRNQNYMLTAKGFSKYIWDFEASSYQNLYGRYSSYGQIHFTKPKEKISSYHPEKTKWNWSHLPGTTAKYLSKEQLNNNNNDNQHRNFSDKSFLGGLAFNSQVGVFSNYIHDNTFDKSFYARKTIFQFNDGYLFLGSGVRCRDKSNEIHTTLFQNLKRSDNDVVEVDGINKNNNQIGITPRIIKDNYGTSYLFSQENVTLDFNEEFITGYINHGLAPKNAKYQYWMVPNSTPEKVEKLKKESDFYEILKQDISVHSVYDKQKKVLSSVIFNASSPLNINQLSSINIPLIVVIQERGDTLDLMFTNPDMLRPTAKTGSKLTPSEVVQAGKYSSVEIKLNGNYKKIENGSDEIDVKNEKKKTIITFKKAKDGKSYRALLLNVNTADVDTISIVNIQKENNTYKIYTNNQSPFDYSLYQLDGKLLFKNRSKNGEGILSMDNFHNGFYLLCVENEKKQVLQKIINN